MSVLHPPEAELENVFEAGNESYRLAKHVMGKLAREIRVGPKMFQHWMLSTDDFCGDVVAASKMAGDSINVMVADGTGHGLAAALCMMPVSDIFYAMSDKGFSVGGIARELNKKMKAVLPTDRFVATSLATVHWGNRTVEVWNGGGPDLLFISDGGEIVKRWKSQNLPLGVLSDTHFDDKVETYRWDEAGELILCSDGLIEARNPEGELYGMDQFLSQLSQAKKGRRFTSVKEDVLGYLHDLKADDDISFAVVPCPNVMSEVCGPAELEKKVETLVYAADWQLSIDLSTEEIKKLDILPTLLTWLRQMGVSHGDTQRLFLILTELYTNAVDHGLLGLDSKLKSSSEGFDGYLCERTKRLSHLSKASIHIELKRVFEASGDSLIKIRFCDTGEGFDFVPHLKEKAKEGQDFSGRGIDMVRSLVQSLSYSNRGRVVEVDYRLR